MTYFTPLRRKIGVVTLVMACVFAAGWVRSQHREDELYLPLRHTLYKLRSTRDNLWICYAHDPSQDLRRHWIDILPIGEDGISIIIADTPSVIWWQSTAKTDFRSASYDFMLDLEDLDRDSKPETWKIFGIRRDAKNFEFFDSENGIFKETIVLYISPYWSIVIPLALLSAWLLLSKPHRKQPATSRLQQM